ncbi:D-isomer specific 2-hydroxyacid dehydrogenase, partial [Paraphoma chrysanthemicola]
METSTNQRNYACDRCSRRKQRCDRALPKCGQCLLAGSACVDSSREGSVVQLNDHEVARKGHVTTLHERISSVKQQLYEKGITATVTEEEAMHEMRNTRNGNPSSGQDEFSTLPQPHETVDLDETTLALSTMAEPVNRSSEFLKHLSMSRIIAGMTEAYGGDPEKTTRVDSLWDGISKYIRHPSSQGHRLHISKPEALRALDAYLSVVDFRFPRLAVDKVRSGIEAITVPDDALHQRLYAKNPAHVFMAYMVIAIIPLISDQYPISQGSFVSIHVVAKCMRVLDRVFSLEDGVDIIQCLHLLVIFSIHCSAAGSAWHLIGLAMSKCIALGYHREQTSAGEVALQELEQRRWVFWGCYHLDRLLGAALGRPCSIEDRYITVALPGSTGRETRSLRDSDVLHVHVFRYAQLLSTTACTTTSPSFDESLSRLIHWRASTPSFKDDNLKQVYLFQTSLYHTSVLRLVINEINAAYSFGSSLDLQTTVYIGYQESCQDAIGSLQPPKDEKYHLERIALLSVCQAVSRSLDRRHMAGRHYLSITTGYSALSMALITLYGIYVNSNSIEMLSDPLEWDDAVAKDILDIAFQKLDIVGRQFPRLHEYQNLVDQLRLFNHLLHTIEVGSVQVSVAWKKIQDQALRIDIFPPFSFPPLHNTRDSPLVIMAPYLNSPEVSHPETRQKLYILSDFHPAAVKYAQSLFECVLHTDPEAENWRSNAIAILVKDYYITEEDLIAAPQLRVIGKQGVGLDKIDVEACTKHNVKICSTPGVNAGAVAEMALCLAFSVARSVPQLVLRQRIHGESIRKETIAGLLLSRKTLGVVGMGNIGQAVARMFSGGLQAKIVAYDPYWPEESDAWASIPHKRVHNLEDLLKMSDVVTLHVPLTAATKDMIGYKQLSQMKRTAILLNTARGGIVNEEELAQGLEEGLIWGAGFDCHAVEPPPLAKYERLWSCPNFVGTPHVAAAVDETQIATINAATDGVWGFLKEKGLSI